MRTKSPLTEWREQSGLSASELADPINVPRAEIIGAETGGQGLIGEPQDYLTLI